jgi:hypothetical protein
MIVSMVAPAVAMARKAAALIMSPSFAWEMSSQRCIANAAHETGARAVRSSIFFAFTSAAGLLGTKIHRISAQTVCRTRAQFASRSAMRRFCHSAISVSTHPTDF